MSPLLHNSLSPSIVLPAIPCAPCTMYVWRVLCAITPCAQCSALSAVQFLCNCCSTILCAPLCSWAPNVLLQEDSIAGVSLPLLAWSAEYFGSLHVITQYTIQETQYTKQDSATSISGHHLTVKLQWWSSCSSSSSSPSSSA